MKPFLLGLTGGIGSGKSTVASILKSLGAEVVSGDELGHLVRAQSEIITQIRVRFGDEVVNPEGSLNRPALGQRVFSDPEQVRWLTDLTFPGIYALWQQAIAKTQSEVIVLDAALIFEWGIEHEFDELWVAVVADEVQVVERVSRSGRLSPAEVRARLAAQMDVREKIQAADQVIRNDGSVMELEKRVRDLWRSSIEPKLRQRDERTR